MHSRITRFSHSAAAAPLNVAINLTRMVKLLPALPRVQAIDPERERAWEGEFSGAWGLAERTGLILKARLVLEHGVLEGEGHSPNFPVDASRDDQRCDVTGAVKGDGVHFELWFRSSRINRNPILCEATLSSDGNEMSGAWRLGCLDPPVCGCEGGGGSFVLKRVR